MDLILIVVLGGLMHAARTFAPQQAAGSDPAGTILACGYLLLSAYLAGNVFKQLRLPRLTGYLATGIVVGPHVVGLLNEPMVRDLRIFNGVAVALLAFNAGVEMHFASIRPLLRTIAWIIGLAILGTTLLLAVALFVLKGFLPFMHDLSLVQAGAIALVLGAVMSAQSPAVVMALRDETRAEGPVSRTALAVVVFADLVVIMMFALFSSLAKATMGADTDVMATVRALAWEIGASIGVGLAVGGLLVLFLRKIQAGGALFLVVVCFVVAEVGGRVHLDPLLIALTAGILVRNGTEMGDRLLEAIDAASMPIYVAFFAVAGAGMHISALKTVGIPVAIFAILRAAGFLYGTRTAARLAGAPDSVGRYAGFGLIPQAGMALALALLFARTFPSLGDEAAALVFGIVACNELLAPILFRVALFRSGEAGQRAGAATTLAH